MQFKILYYRSLDASSHNRVDLEYETNPICPCREAFPGLNEMRREYQRLGLMIVGINLDEARAEADRFLTNTPAEFTVHYDPKGVLAKYYGHLLNSKTGWPIEASLRSATVAAGTCTKAGLLATLALLQGPDAETFLQHQDVQYWLTP